MPTAKLANARRLFQMEVTTKVRYFFETNKGNGEKAPTFTSQDFASH